MTAPRYDRRAFLELGCAALGAAAFAACGGGSSRSDVPVGALRALYADRERVEAVGTRAVGVDEVGSRAPTLAAQLSPTGSAAGLAAATAPALRAHLRRAVDEDFARGRVVDVAGWQLALTEARVAALLHLTR